MKEMSNLFSTKRGYVLDGYPTTADQARQIFSNTNSPQQIDINKLPSNSTKKIFYFYCFPYYVLLLFVLYP